MYEVISFNDISCFLTFSICLSYITEDGTLNENRILTKLDKSVVNKELKQNRKRKLRGNDRYPIQQSKVEKWKTNIQLETIIDLTDKDNKIQVVKSEKENETSGVFFMTKDCTQDVYSFTKRAFINKKMETKRHSRNLLIICWFFTIIF